MLVPAKPTPLSAEERITAYSTTGEGLTTTPDKADGVVLDSAREAAAGLLERNRGLDARITHRLEGAGSDLKSSEWLLLHAAVFVGSGVLGLVIGQGGLALGLVFLALGAVGPWVYLSIRRRRRHKAFHSGLPDTLQLISGSLSAGLSLAQAMDTVVREGSEPVASEFRRVLIETRLGVPLEDALAGWPSGSRARTSSGWSWRSRSSGRSAATSPSCWTPWLPRCGSASTCAAR